MSDIKDIRARLGMTQADFADLLNCNRVQLAYAEAGQRSLPPATAQMLRLLENLPDALTANKPARENKLTPNEHHLLAKELKVRSLKLSKLEILTEQLEIKLTACSNRWQVASHLLQQASDITAISYLQLQVLQRQAAEKKTKYQQQLLTCLIEIAGLQAAIIKATELKNF